MTNREVYEIFDKIGCCTFATIDGDYPETRIAHFLASDKEGLYFMTMKTKPFYRQLVKTGKVSVCGMSASPKVEETEEGDLKFEAGYFARLTGDVREVSLDRLRSKMNPAFDYCFADVERYPAMTTFVLYRGRGEIYDYDFEMEHREHKLLRQRFSLGGMEIVPSGLSINPNICIGCGRCKARCSFKAIVRDGDKFKIDGMHCDECGNCYQTCPAGAITHKGL